MSQPVEIDPRGQRFNAALTSVVLAAAIVATDTVPAAAITPKIGGTCASRTITTGSRRWWINGCPA